jgi:hypothetical protein
MPRSRTLRESSGLRHKAKIMKLFPTTDPELQKAIADAVNSTWNQKFGEYHMVWEEVKTQLYKQFPDLKRGELGLIRSYVLKAIKNKRQGGNLDALAEDYAQKTGIPSEVLSFINNYIKGLTF